MVPYIFVFSLNYLLAYYADQKYDANRYKAVLFLIAIGILDVIFAGCRDFGVGYDTNVYIDLYFNEAKSLANVSGFFNAEGMDKGFLFLAYISTLLSNSSQSLLFVTEAFIITLTLAGLYNFKRTLKINISTFILLYWLILFFFSLNFMRQYCAMAILFYGYSYWQRDKKCVYLFFQILAYFLHSTSALFVFVPILDYMSKMQTGKKVLLSVCVLALLVFSTVFFYTVFSFMGEYSLISDVYSDRYSGHGSKTGGLNMGMISILIIIIQISLYILARKEKSMTNQHLYMMLMLFVITYLFQMLVTFNVNLNRMALYFNQIYILYLSLSLKANQNFIKVILKPILTILLLIICIRFSFNHNYEPQDYTYSSKILGINK